MPPKGFGWASMAIWPALAVPCRCSRIKAAGDDRAAAEHRSATTWRPWGKNRRSERFSRQLKGQKADKRTLLSAAKFASRTYLTTQTSSECALKRVRQRRSEVGRSPDQTGTDITRADPDPD